MTEQSEVTLLPCPFCGGEAQACGNTFIAPNGSEGMHWVLCGACHAGPGDRSTPAAAIAAWNTRSQPSDDELLREARDDFSMCISEIARARGRLEALSTCNEDRRIASALGATLDHLRRRWFASETRIDARLNGEKP